MIGAGTFLNPLLKIITVVAVLAATYFFILKPILDTTDNAINQSLKGLTPALQQATDISPQLNRTIRQANRLQEQSAQTSQQQIREANKLLGCIQRAGGNVDKIQHCNDKYAL